MAVTSDRHICRRVKLNGEVEEVEGTIKAEYDFDKKWELKDMEDENDFLLKEKTDKALNVTLLLTVLYRLEIHFFGGLAYGM